MPDAAIVADDALPRRPRQPRLDSVVRIRREAARLFREGRDGTRPAGDVHHLTASLAIIGGMLEGQSR